MSRQYRCDRLMEVCDHWQQCICHCEGKHACEILTSSSTHIDCQVALGLARAVQLRGRWRPRRRCCSESGRRRPATARQVKTSRLRSLPRQAGGLSSNFASLPEAGASKCLQCAMPAETWKHPKFHKERRGQVRPAGGGPPSAAAQPTALERGAVPLRARPLLVQAHYAPEPQS